MAREVLDSEIKGAMFSIGNDKAPGPDGFTSVFFKKAWEVVGGDVCKALETFSQMGSCFKRLTTRSLHCFLRYLPLLVLMIFVLFHVATSFISALAKLLLIGFRTGWMMWLVAINQLLYMVVVSQIISFLLKN